MNISFDLQTLLLASAVIAVAFLLLGSFWKFLVRFVKVWIFTLVVLLAAFLAYRYVVPAFM